MTNQQILEHAIQKAVDGGWSPPSLLKALYANPSAPFYSMEGQHVEMIRGMITSHDFAKALWGEDLVLGFKGNSLGQTYQYHEPAWIHHLQQMVIAEDPIKYLGENNEKNQD